MYVLVRILRWKLRFSLGDFDEMGGGSPAAPPAAIPLFLGNVGSATFNGREGPLVLLCQADRVVHHQEGVVQKLTVGWPSS